MLGFRRAQPTSCPQKLAWHDPLMTTDIDAKLPHRPSFDGYKIDVLFP
jgi:hypothetical protein